MTSTHRPPITDAVILMAGAGSRLGDSAGGLAKPLVPIAGRPLICHALDALHRAGVRRIWAVMGAQSEKLTEEMRALLPSRMTLHALVNPDWQKQNGVSVLCAEGHVIAPFFLAMGDHLYEFGILEALLTHGDRACVNLAIDRKIDSIFDLDDAMKVKLEDDRMVAIAKDLTDYNAVDTGVFLCSNDLFAALRRAQNDTGDCSLADGVRLLAEEGKMRAVDVGDAWWQDVDTPEMLAQAEEESARRLWHDPSGLPQESVASQQ